LTQSQLSELLDTESARTLIEAGEERGWIEPAELEAFAVENDLPEAEIADVVKELERIGLEPRKRTRSTSRSLSSTRLQHLRARATACSSSSPTSASTSS